MKRRMLAGLLPAFLVLWQGYEIKGENAFDRLAVNAFASMEEIEAWLNDCETSVVIEDGQRLEQESCSPRFVPGDDTGTLIGIYELGAPIEDALRLTGPTDPAKDDYNPRWKLR